MFEISAQNSEILKSLQSFWLATLYASSVLILWNSASPAARK